MVISSFSLNKAEKYNTGPYWTCWTTICHWYSVYIISVSLKLNVFIEYFETMIRVRVMFTCLLRHHYNKAPLIRLEMVTYWGKNNPELYKLIWKHLVIVDEYPVENVHNIIRSKTNDHDSSEKMKDSKGYISEQTSSRQLSKILAAKNYSMFSQKHINNLKLRCAKLLVVCFPT